MPVSYNPRLSHEEEIKSVNEILMNGVGLGGGYNLGGK